MEIDKDQGGLLRCVICEYIPLCRNCAWPLCEQDRNCNVCCCCLGLRIKKCGNFHPHPELRRRLREQGRQERQPVSQFHISTPRSHSGSEEDAGEDEERQQGEREELIRAAVIGIPLVIGQGRIPAQTPSAPIESPPESIDEERVQQPDGQPREGVTEAHEDHTQDQTQDKRRGRRGISRGP